MLTNGSDADIADGSPELDEGMSLVVLIGWAGLAAGTEIGVMADGTLVSVTNNVCRVSAVQVAERSVTADAVMTRLLAESTRRCGDISNWLIDGHKSVARVNEVSIDDAAAAVVPVRAVKALVADTVDILVTAITDCVVASIAAGCKKLLSNFVKLHVLLGTLECMLGVVTMLVLDEARDAQIEIIAHSASDEFLIAIFCTRVSLWLLYIVGFRC